MNKLIEQIIEKENDIKFSIRNNYDKTAFYNLKGGYVSITQRKKDVQIYMSKTYGTWEYMHVYSNINELFEFYKKYIKILKLEEILK